MYNPMRINNLSSTKANNRFKIIQSEFENIHGTFYDYSDSVYTTFKQKMKIICPLHGSFSVTPQKHLNGQGCPICAQISSNGHLNVSEHNLLNYRDLLLEYLEELYPNFDFSELSISKNVFQFKCKKHGPINNKKIACTSCKQDEFTEFKLTKFKQHLNNRNENIIELCNDYVQLFN